ncbi:hypothetical protein COW86_01515 [Candidatus Kuenenbacteria bacterium CG22_combo_CG10-13_8_21_14_all_39_9]|uniref:Uncharacterized protein n=1 Tax=Candidatus Kuenenbacteria bacterium CG22_combo_CG10-13_8_21_14_all_39_9 TaxID=1974621 RepID=A0A2H0D123_9BACT|nr:MAG: hypothetical protein COW86_01515 [Candidatus Kuenenbacteria bacterium CG22_combo_CG10-13_8_21_14_all_39_9]
MFAKRTSKTQVPPKAEKSHPRKIKNFSLSGVFYLAGESKSYPHGQNSIDNYFKNYIFNYRKRFILNKRIHPERNEK